MTTRLCTIIIDSDELTAYCDYHERPCYYDHELGGWRCPVQDS